MTVQVQTKPAASALARLHEFDQAVWIDFLARRFLADGDLKKLIKEDGVTGVTSNPSIFEKAIGHGTDYDDELKAAATEGDRDPMLLYERLAIADIREAADQLRP